MTRPLVQVVDVLGDDQEVAAERLLQPGQGEVGGVGLDPGQRGTTLVVEAVDQVRFGGVGLGRRDQHRVVALPQPVCVPEGREPALGGDAGAGQDDDAHGSSEVPGRRRHRAIITPHPAAHVAAPSAPSIRTTPWSGVRGHSAQAAVAGCVTRRPWTPDPPTTADVRPLAIVAPQPCQSTRAHHNGALPRMIRG